jgi:hypothetical protein
MFAVFSDDVSYMAPNTQGQGSLSSYSRKLQL